MAQPTPYVREFNFSNQQAETPSEPLPAPHVDAEFNRIKLTTDEILENLSLIQDDEGGLIGSAVGGGTIGFDQLAPDVVTAINTDGSGTPEAFAAALANALPDATLQMDWQGSAPTLLKYLFAEDIPVWAFTDEGTQLELGEDGDPDHNSAIWDKMLFACGYDTAKIRGALGPTGLVNLRNGQHGVPNGVRMKGQGAVERLDRIGTTIQGVGPGDTFRLQGDVDAASGQHYFGGKIIDFTFRGDDTQPHGIGQSSGDHISFLTLGGDDVAPQDNCFIGDNIFRHPPRHGIYSPRGLVPGTFARNKFRECGGAGHYVDAGFNIQSAHFLDYSGDRNISGVLYLKNFVDTGNILISNLKSEMHKNTRYGNVNAQLIAVHIVDCEEGTTIFLNGATHISAVIEGGYRRRTGDLVSITGSEVPDMWWKGCKIRLNFGGQVDDPGDPEAYYVRTPWKTYARGTDYIYASRRSFGHQIHDDEGFEYFGEEDRYFNRTVENVGRQNNGVTPAWGWHETDGAANNRTALVTLSGGSLQFRFATDETLDGDGEIDTPAVATTALSFNQTDGAPRNIQATVPCRDGVFTIAQLQANVFPCHAASNPNCEVVVSDGTSAHGRKAMSMDIVTPGTWRWYYTLDNTAV